MGRKRLGDERRMFVALRLPKEIIETVKKYGTITEIIEKAVREYIKRQK